MARIGFICGSLRSGSINRQLETALAHIYADAGCETEIIDLADYPLPIFNGDAPRPDTLQPLADRIATCEGIVVVTPEYNGGLPALLKNSIDYLSTLGDQTFKGRAWGVAACTPGPLSGVVCLRTLTLLLMRIGGQVVPTMIGVGNASKAFDAERLLHDGLPHKLALQQVEEMRRAINARA